MCVCVLTDRVVDDLNPGLNFTRKEVESLLHFVEEEAGQFSLAVQEDSEEVLYQACKLYPHLITKVLSHLTVLIALFYSVAPSSAQQQKETFKERLESDFLFTVSAFV